MKAKMTMTLLLTSLCLVQTFVTTSSGQTVNTKVNVTQGDATSGNPSNTTRICDKGATLTADFPPSAWWSPRDGNPWPPAHYAMFTLPGNNTTLGSGVYPWAMVYGFWHRGPFIPRSQFTTGGTLVGATMNLPSNTYARAYHLDGTACSTTEIRIVEDLTTSPVGNYYIDYKRSLVTDYVYKNWYPQFDRTLANPGYVTYCVPNNQGYYLVFVADGFAWTTSYRPKDVRLTKPYHSYVYVKKGNSSLSTPVTNLEVMLLNQNKTSIQNPLQVRTGSGSADSGRAMFSVPTNCPPGIFAVVYENCWHYSTLDSSYANPVTKTIYLPQLLSQIIVSKNGSPVPNVKLAVINDSDYYTFNRFEQNTTNTNYSFNYGIPDGHVFRVMMQTADEALTFTTAKTAPQNVTCAPMAYTALNPADYTTVPLNTEQRFTWDTVPGASIYAIKYAVSNNGGQTFTNWALQVTEGVTTNFAYVDMTSQADMILAWQAQAYDADGKLLTQSATRFALFGSPLGPQNKNNTTAYLSSKETDLKTKLSESMAPVFHDELSLSDRQGIAFSDDTTNVSEDVKNLVRQEMSLMQMNFDGNPIEPGILPDDERFVPEGLEYFDENSTFDTFPDEMVPGDPSSYQPDSGEYDFEEYPPEWLDFMEYLWPGLTDYK